MANVGLSVAPSTPTTIRRTDGKDAASALADLHLDALYSCEAGYDVTSTIFDHPSRAAARAAVEKDSASAANFTTGTRDRLPPRLAAFGYIVDVPDTQAASVKWQHGDLQVDVLIEYTDQKLSHQKVAQVLRDVVLFMDGRLGPG